MKNYKGKFVSFKYRDRKEIIRGFVIDYNEDWTLIKYNPVDYIIDGYCILKSKKILNYKRDESEKFTEKVLHAKGLKVTENDKFPLTNIHETLKLISDKFGAFKIELKNDKICFVGRLTSYTKREIIIQEIDPKAKWCEFEKFKLDTIRIIEFDIDYVNSLILYNKKNNNK